MNLSRLEEEAKRDPVRLSESIKDAKDLIQNLTQEIRTTSYLLHPPMLDESGLSSALRWYTEGLAARSGLTIELNIPDNLERLAPEVELTIFRLVQECLTNIHRHSGSKTAVIRIACEPDKIYAEVQDHGRGMSQERFAEVQSQGVGVGVGIRGMRERVRQSHGELIVVPLAVLAKGKPLGSWNDGTLRSIKSNVSARNRIVSKMWTLDCSTQRKMLIPSTLIPSATGGQPRFSPH
jgi:signal transduction histidine kinase